MGRGPRRRRAFSQQPAARKYQSACKPGSVWRRASATAIHLGRRLLGASCNQPGQRRGPRLAQQANPPRRAAPIRFCSRWGLPCHLCHQRRGALLPHPFTLAAAGEPASAVCFLWHFPWGCPRRPLAATVDPWSPDFPPPQHCLRSVRQRPSSRLISPAIRGAHGPPSSSSRCRSWCNSGRVPAHHGLDLEVFLDAVAAPLAAVARHAVAAERC